VPCCLAGVHLKNGNTLSSDLVIDASGKDSHVSKWLQQLDHEPPATMSVEAGLRYTYCMYEMTDDPSRDWLLAMCMNHPTNNKAAMMIPVETNKWQVMAL